MDHLKQAQCRPPMTKTSSRHSVTSSGSTTGLTSPLEEGKGSVTDIGGISASSSGVTGSIATGGTASIPSDSSQQSLQRRDSQTSQTSIGGTVRSRPSTGATDEVPVTSTRPIFGRQGSTASATSIGGTGDDSEDTMKNLRKTFAGIFGDMVTKLLEMAKNSMDQVITGTRIHLLQRIKGSMILLHERSKSEQIHNTSVVAE
ncbi:hypothetical protein J437_LFUL014214, partial [Ladona fulva]